MTEEIQPGAEAPEQEPIAHEAPPEGAAEGHESEAPERQESAPELETVAAAMGWRPDGGNKTAAEYIRDTVSVNQSLRQRLDRQEQEFSKRVQGIQRMSEQALTNQRAQLLHQRAQLLQQWEAAKDSAVATGDMDRYRQLQQGQSQAIQHFDEHVIAPAVREPQERQQEQEDMPADVKAAVSDFAVRNPWYIKDEVMTGAAVGIMAEVDKQYSHFMPLEKRLALVERRMQEEFPHKFKSNGATAQTTPGVEGGLRAIRTNRGKGFNELPPEAKQQASKDVKQGLFKDVHEWAKEYYTSGD